MFVISYDRGEFAQALLCILSIHYIQVSIEEVQVRQFRVIGRGLDQIDQSNSFLRLVCH